MTAQKTAKTVASLSKLMPNVGGPCSSKRKILASVAHSTMMYAAPAWKDGLRYKKYVLLLEKEQRKLAIRVISAYRTVSTEAALVLAGITPIDIMAEERASNYNGDNTAHSKNINRADAVRKWQRRWDSGTKGRWTHRLIGNIETWITRKHGELNYWLTQMMTGHGSFQQYLNRIGKIERGECEHCAQETDDAEHAVFMCGRWAQLRTTTELEVGERITPENIIRLRCRQEENWKKISGMVCRIMKEKEGRI